MSGRVLVSIHDVTPALADEVVTLGTLCAERGVEPALLIVPQWHGGHPVEESPSHLQWLRERAAAGAELFLHGERHDEAGLPRSWRDQVRALGRTAREGEFLTLDEPAARLRIERGIARLVRLGLPPVGFVAPGWLARPDTYRAVAAAGLRFSEDVAHVNLHDRGMRLDAPVIRWSARSAWRARGSARAARVMRLIHRRAWTIRIALHPADLHDRRTARSVVDTLDECLSARRVGRYAAL